MNRCPTTSWLSYPMADSHRGFTLRITPYSYVLYNITGTMLKMTSAHSLIRLESLSALDIPNWVSGFIN